MRKVHRQGQEGAFQPLTLQALGRCGGGISSHTTFCGGMWWLVFNFVVSFTISDSDEI